ncbi:hypothetical protein [Yersinia pseudotuberculosis]|uniref:hypothetical protein n=1 Tax=Yersinia pseudotuberculosis TaxID=633 RepID=UPI0038B5601D
MLSKEQLEKIANQGPVDIGGAQNPIVTEMATELLSLREQLAALKALAPVGHVNQDELDNIEPGVSAAMIYPERDAYSSVPLFTAAKPVED